MIYISIPAHNEAGTLGAVLWKVRHAMAEFERDFELVVFDDASTDSTPDVLERYQNRLPLRVLRSEERIGYGPAVERLMRDALERAPYPKRDVVVILQADFTQDPDDLVPMIKAIEGGADLVAGRREGVDMKRPRGVRLAQWASRRVLGRAWRRAPVEDPFAGMRAYRVIVLRKAFRGEDPHLVRTRDEWPASLELLALTVPFARRIEESPYGLRYAHRQGRSRVDPVPLLKQMVSLRKVNWVTATESD